MPSLDDFNMVNKTLGLEDFVAPLPNVGGTNKASNQNMAAQVASMSQDGTQVYDNYVAVRDELGMEGQSDVGQQLAEEARREHMKGNREGLISLLSDPTISDEDKQNIALGAVDKANEAWKFENVISDNALMQPSEGETPDQEFVRVSLADEVEKLNHIKREKQKMLMAEINKNNVGFGETVGEIAELLVPFVEGQFVADVMQELGIESDNPIIGSDKAIAFLGHAKMDIKELIANAPAHLQLELTQKVIDAVNKSSGIALQGENDFARVDFLRSVLEDGYYEDGLKWVDTVTSVLDLVGIGGLARSINKGAKAADALSNASREAARSGVQPASLSQNLKDTNPSKARAAHETAAADETGEAAEALYGSTREDAVANDLMPQIPKDDGSMVVRVEGADGFHNQTITPDPEVMDLVKSDGAIYYFESEKIQMRSHAVNDFANAIGMKARPELSSHAVTGDGVMIRQVYGSNGSSPQELLDRTKMALRGYDVPDDAITLMRREGDEYVPTTIREIEAMESVTKVMKTKGKQPRNVVVTQPKDFVVQVRHDYKFNPADITTYAQANVKWNLFDRIPFFNGSLGGGSLMQHALDAHSMLHPNLTLGANVAVDRAAGLEKVLLDSGKQFSDGFAKSKNPQLMERHIKEANEKGQAFDFAKMRADGMSDADIAAMRNWEDYWENMYILENRDMAKTLSARGYQEFANNLTGTRLFAKPVVRQRAKAGVQVWDDDAGAIVKLDEPQLKDLYANQGNIAHLRQPMLVGTDAVEFVLNKAGSKNMKAIGNNSQVLNHRKGYYSVKYQDPQFVVKVVSDAQGNTLYEQAVATAGSIGDADTMVARMQGADQNGFKYYRRGDVKKEITSSDDNWDLQVAGGRSAQRIRGKRLEDGTGSSHAMQQNILSPVDSLVNAARSTARRVEMRSYLEATKARFMAQYKDVLPVDKFGNPRYPNKIDEVHWRGGVSENQKNLADAKTTFNYIQSLEHGWQNAIDDGYKAIVKAIGHAAGEHGGKAGKAIEKGAQVAGRGLKSTPMGFMRNTAFQLYLALNPIRQFIVQSHQAVQLLAAYPQGMAKSVANGEVAALFQNAMGFGQQAKHAEVIKDFERSGLSAAVDKNNLISGSLTDMADSRTILPKPVVKAGQLVGKVAGKVRKYGFDAGENMNLITAWTAIRQDMLSKLPKGHKLTDTELDEIGGLARNYTYNMNKAGDMPYNQNALNVVLQFAQVPHKAITQMLFNRALTPMQKGRIAMFNLAMYGAPAGLVYNHMGHILPEDQATRDLLVNGLEDFTFNYIAQTAFGDNTRINYGSLAPTDFMGVQETIIRALTEDIGTLVTESPSGRLFFGNNPKVSNMVRDIGRYTNHIIDPDATPIGLDQIGLDFMKLSSGFSSAYKAAYALKRGIKLGSTGGVTDPEITTAEGWAQLAGFETHDEAQKRAVNTATYEKSKAFEEDVGEWYTEFKRHLMKEGVSNLDREYSQKVLSEAWSVWGNDNYKAKQIIVRKIQRDVKDGDMRVINQLLKMTGFMSATDLKKMVMQLPNVTEEQRKEIMGTINSIESHKETE